MSTTVGFDKFDLPCVRDIASIISDKHPQNFEWEPITITDNKRSKAISSLRETDQTTIRLSDYIPDYRHFGRYRINMMKVIFLDNDGNILPRQPQKKVKTEVRITFPSLFTDKDEYGQKYTFFSNQKFDCTSKYWSFLPSGM